MRKFLKYAGLLALLAVLLPQAALAHSPKFLGPPIRVESDDKGNNTESKHEVGNIELKEVEVEHHSRTGTVTAVGTNSFTLKANDGIVYTVNTTGAKLMGPFGTVLAFSDIHVNDKANVRGTVDATTNTIPPGVRMITATSVIIIPANTKPARIKGTVTAVSGNTVTVQTKHNDTVTVNTASNTTVTKADGTAGTTADVTVGTNVKVKGLWNMLLNVLSAIKIKLK
jgi:hypothetical protein